MNLAKNLETRCAEQSITFNKLAKLARISPATLHGWKTGRKAANLEDLRRVAEALQISIHELVFDIPDPYAAAGQEILKELFTGDVRVTVHRIERNK